MHYWSGDGHMAVLYILGRKFTGGFQAQCDCISSLKKGVL